MSAKEYIERLMMQKSDYQEEFNKKLLLGIVFLLTTLFFLRQHYLYTSWDFSAFVLNAKFFFAQGSYFELLRPPLVPIMLGILHFPFGWKIAEYVLIICINCIFLYSVILFAKKVQWNSVLLYVLFLTPYVLSYGLVNGTELLFVAFVIFVLYFILSDSIWSGVFLGICALTRYTGIALFPIIIFHTSWKKRIIATVLFGLTFFPWFMYNFITTGNFFTSIADQYANNILFRSHIHQSISLNHIMILIGGFQILFLLGMFLSIKTLISHQKEWPGIKKNIQLIGRNSLIKAHCIVLILLTYGIISYITTPMKNARYLFILIIPITFYAYIGTNFLIQKITHYIPKKYKSLFFNTVILVMCILSIGVVWHHFETNTQFDANRQTILDTVEIIQTYNLTTSYIRSNAWVFLQYNDIFAAPFPDKRIVSHYANQNQTFVYIYGFGEPPYTSKEIHNTSYVIIYEDTQRIIFSKSDPSNINSIIKETLDTTYMDNAKEQILLTYNNTINIEPCFILFHSIELGERVCNVINFNGLTINSNRQLP